MKKGLLYILTHFLSAVIADWITVEHDFKMCDQVVPSNRAAFHINDDGISYSTSLLIRRVKTIRHEPPLTTSNITMWGCTYDCNFSFMVEINRNNLSVSTYTEKNSNNYKCNLSNYTMKLIPTPKVTYNGNSPDPNHVFPPHLTAQYCSEGKHPDKPSWAINRTEHIAECIDNLTGHEAGSYAASLQFGSGSSFSPDGYPVATYHMINSANKLFNYWDSHHRGFHDALNELSMKMNINNLKNLYPPPPPPHKVNMLLAIVTLVVTVVILASPMVVELGPEVVAVDEIAETIAETSELGAEIGAADDVIATTAEGSIARNAAVGWRTEAQASNAAYRAQRAAYDYDRIKGLINMCVDIGCREEYAMQRIAQYYSNSRNPNLAQMLAAINRMHGFPLPRKRDLTTIDNIGAFTASMVNMYFLPSLMENVHQSFTGDGQTYPDISSYLSAARENLLFHFNDTLHNNFFTANKSLLASFTINQGINYDQILDSDDDLYNSIKNSTYNNMAASIISNTLRHVNVDICDPKPSFCGQPCDHGHIYCPIVGNDTNNCVIAASDGQIKELKYLRDTFDICSTDNSTGWNITRNNNCDIKQFQCQ